MDDKSTTKGNTLKSDIHTMNTYKYVKRRLEEETSTEHTKKKSKPKRETNKERNNKKKHFF